MNSTEQWKDVPGYEGSYQVSDCGRVLSLERRCDVNGGTRRVRQRLLKQTVRFKSGVAENCIVKLSNGSEKPEYSSVGRLVLRAFVREPIGDEVAHFLDGDPQNSALLNLMWSTYSSIAVARGYKPPRKRKAATEIGGAA